jgi:TolA-binding protein
MDLLGNNKQEWETAADNAEKTLKEGANNVNKILESTKQKKEDIIANLDIIKKKIQECADSSDNIDKLNEQIKEMNKKIEDFEKKIKDLNESKGNNEKKIKELEKSKEDLQKKVKEKFDKLTNLINENQNRLGEELSKHLEEIVQNVDGIIEVVNDPDNTWKDSEGETSSGSEKLPLKPRSHRVVNPPSDHTDYFKKIDLLVSPNKKHHEGLQEANKDHIYEENVNVTSSEHTGSSHIKGKKLTMFIYHNGNERTIPIIMDPTKIEKNKDESIKDYIYVDKTNRINTYYDGEMDKSGIYTKALRQDQKHLHIFFNDHKINHVFSGRPFNYDSKQMGGIKKGGRKTIKLKKKIKGGKKKITFKYKKNPHKKKTRKYKK